MTTRQLVSNMKRLNVSSFCSSERVQDDNTDEKFEEITEGEWGLWRNERLLIYV